MGFFSFTTADTNESIYNVESGKPVKTVYLLQPKQADPIEESAYFGYGDFGGVDCYSWLARVNAESLGIDIANHGKGEIRSLGVYLWWERRNELLYPFKFSFNKDAIYEHLPTSGDCPHQGFF